MVTRYVGIGGNDGNSGLTWALRKLTLNGVEDTPVVAGDTVYVGPGAYRELLTVDIDGGAGTIITYIGDRTGEHTDGIGGEVRVTGSDNDQTGARNYCVHAVSKDYRTFRGFTFDSALSNLIYLDDGCQHWVIEDCTFQGGFANDDIHVDDAQLDITIRRCRFFGAARNGIYFLDAVAQDNVGHLVENCVFLCGGAKKAIAVDRIGGITVRNCLIALCSYGIDQQQALTAGQTIDVENCIFYACYLALDATALGFIVEDFNTFHANTTDRNNVAVGGNSQTYPPLFILPLLFSGVAQVSGYKFPFLEGDLSRWSQIARITGSNEPAEDYYGIPRPVTASKNSWGPMQYVERNIETGTVQAGTQARELPDAGQIRVFRVPCAAEATTVTLYMRYEADYSGGNLPRMIIKQPGVADRVTTMTVGANTWQQLSDTFTPAATPSYFEVWVESRNTAGAGNYKVYYDTFDVS